MRPVDDIMNGIMVTVFCFQILSNSIARGIYFWSFSEYLVAMLWSFGIEMSIRYVCFLFLSVNVISGLLHESVLSDCRVLSQYSL